MRQLQVTRQFERDFAKLTTSLKDNLDYMTTLLLNDPTSSVLGAKKLVNIKPATWRIRVGPYRLLYTYNVKTLTLLRVAHRRDIYK